ncbi:MAG: tRNA 2-thiouridine(34) synthase MnmA [Bacteroidales bacterium]|nr:tRNA 2-thiouridine(34) synthase MnmA [Bacteroidales bacterium]
MKVCVGLSGGVDSSVAALLLKRQGYDVFAMFMQNWHDADATLHGDCEWEEDRFVAEIVARKIGIPFYFVDLSKEYRQRVVDYMFNEYSSGRTPNPDILCNREIKFDAFYEAARKLGADMVATGHYCRRAPLLDSDGKQIVIDGQPQWRILEGTDPNKDQSYFLCQLTQEQLGKSLFPIGHLTKPEVRQIAHLADLPSADKKDSQGICFVGKVDLPTFLKQKLEPKEGDVVEVYDRFFQDNAQYAFVHDTLASLLATLGEPEMITAFSSEDSGGASFNNQRVEVTVPDQTAGTNVFDPVKLAELSDGDWMRLAEPIDYSGIKFETEVYRSGKKHVKKVRYKENPLGRIVGHHDGAQFFTIGQRKGLNIGGHQDSIFVIGTDIERNIIYVGEGHGHKGLSRCCVRIVPEDIHWIRRDLEMMDGEVRRYRVRIRYRQPLQDAWLVKRPVGMFILFDMPQRGLSSGQFAAWYSDEDEMLGSGVY